MKHNLTSSGIMGIVAFCTVVLTGCSAIQGVFKAGMWSGIIFVVIIIAVIIFIITRLGNRN